MSVVEHGHEAKAEHAIKRLQTSNTGLGVPTPSQSVALLSQTNQIEKRLTEGAGYSECFKGTNLRRTEITVGTWVTQQMVGPVLQVRRDLKTAEKDKAKVRHMQFTFSSKPVFRSKDLSQWDLH